MSDTNSTNPDRRTFLQLAGALVGASVAGASAQGTQAAAQQPAGTLSAGFAAPPIPEVRIGFVGVGGQGSAHVRNMLGVPGARITAVCDIAEDRVKLMQKWVIEAGQQGTGWPTRADHATSSGCAKRRTSISSSTPRRGSGTCRCAWPR